MENQNQEKAARAIGRVAVIGCGRWGSLITWYLSACRCTVARIPRICNASCANGGTTC